MNHDLDTIRVGLIGYGFAGKTLHAPLIQSVPGMNLTIVGSSKPEAVRADLPEVKVCLPQDIPAHAEIDLVVIASPNESHFPLAAAALRAGKSVVIDKPFTVTLAEARSLLAIAEQHKKLLSVFHNRRWDSETRGTKAILESGKLGRVVHYESHIDRFRPAVRRRWREDSGPGAGLWFDLGPHLIDQSLYLFGLPRSVNANFGILRDGGETDDWAHVQLNYDGLRVILQATLIATGGSPRTLLHGTGGSWAKYGADVQESQLLRGMHPTGAGFGYDSDSGIFFDGVTGKRTEIPVPIGEQRMYYVGLRDAILKGEPAPVTAKDALAVMAILEASFDAGRNGRVMPIPLTAEEQACWNVAAGFPATN